MFKIKKKSLCEKLICKKKINANHYNQNSELQKKIALNVFNYHLFIQKEKILDIGCGDGEVTKSLSAYGQTTGIDSCKNMIDFALKYNSTPNTEYINTPFLELKERKKFSLITAFNSIYWCGNLNEIFKKIATLLNADGKFLIVTYPKESPYWIPIINLLNEDKWKTWKSLSITKHWLTTEEYCNLTKNSGLKLSFCDVSIENVYYKSSKEYINYIKGWLPLMFDNSFPIDNFIDDLIKSLWNDTSALNMKYKKVILYGRKK